MYFLTSVGAKKIKQLRKTRQVHTYLVPDEEARTRGCEGPRTSAGVAFSARDISVGEVAQAIPRSEMLHTG